MRRGLVTLAAVWLVALAALAGTAAAAPAQHDTFSGCDVWDDYQYCSTWRGVFKETSTPSGNLMFMGHGTFSSSVTYLPTGEVLSTFSSKGSNGVLIKDGVLHVSRGVGRSSWTFAGTTCTSTWNYVFANGSIRHENFESACS